MNPTYKQLDSYLIGSLNYAGLVHPAGFHKALPSYHHALSQGHYHLPFYLVADLWLLLSKGYQVKFRSEQSHRQIDNATSSFDRKLVIRYERECLARLLRSIQIQTAIEIASTSPQPSLVSERLLVQILSHLAPHYPSEHQLNPGLLRDFDLPESITPSQYPSAIFHTHLETFLGEINAQVNWSQLLYEEDLFELSHLDTLNSDHLRIGCRQILEVNRSLRSSQLPTSDIAAKEDGADTQLIDETHYPAGGLAGLTNRGSFENLLTSELVYLDEGTQDVSLFELRYVERELLFYLRDAGNLRRRRRSIHFILDVSDIFDSKLPGYPWQYSVLVQGMCLRLLHDLFQLFEMDALRFHFHYLQPTHLSDNDRKGFDAEMGIMRTVLSDYAKHDWVSFNTKESIDLESLIDPRRKTYALVIASDRASQTWNDHLQPDHIAELPIHTAQIKVDGQPDTDDQLWLDLPRSGLDTQALISLKNGVLQQLID